MLDYNLIDDFWESKQEDKESKRKEYLLSYLNQKQLAPENLNKFLISNKVFYKKQKKSKNHKKITVQHLNNKKKKYIQSKDQRTKIKNKFKHKAISNSKEEKRSHKRSKKELNKK